MISSTLIVCLMYGEVRAEVNCRSKPLEGLELLISCVSAKRGRSAKSHDHASLAMFVYTFFNSGWLLVNDIL